MIDRSPLSRAIALALAFLLLIALVVIAEISQSGQKQISGLIAQSQRRQILLTELLSDLYAAEDGKRGWMLTDDQKYLHSYQSARAQIEPVVDRLTDLYGAQDRLVSPGQREAIHRLGALVIARLGELATSLSLYTPQHPEQALALMRSGLGARTMGDIRDQAAILREAEQRSVEASLARAERLRAISRALMDCVALLNVTLLIAAAMLLARQARRRNELTEQLERENEALERGVRRRTAELSALSSHLQLLSEKEKATLARELHDELGGLLIAVKMDVSWLQKRWPNPAADIQARWVRVLKVLDDGVDFKRRIVENLRPTLLDNMGLLPALRWIVRETCSRAGLQYTESYPEQEPPLSDDASIMLFRLVQESLTNIVKHAHATSVRVDVGMHEQGLSVLIEDNGTGIETDRREALGSHGLAIMRQRVRSFGGILEIGAVTHGGTRVQARVPLEGIVKRLLEPKEFSPAANESGATVRANALAPAVSSQR